MTDKPVPASAAPRLSQRVRVLGIIALTSLPLLLFGLLNLWRDVVDAESRGVEERVVLAGAVALAAESFVAGNLATLRALAFSRELTSPSDYTEVKRLLERVGQQDPN